MSENGPAEGLVTRTEIAELAGLFDRFEFALDPRAVDAREAEAEFEDRVRRLFDERIAASHPHVDYVTFRGKLRSLCRLYLKMNAP